MTNEPTTEQFLEAAERAEVAFAQPGEVPKLPSTLEEWRAEALEQFGYAQALGVSEAGWRNRAELEARRNATLAARVKKLEEALRAGRTQIEMLGEETEHWEATNALLSMLEPIDALLANSSTEDPKDAQIAALQHDRWNLVAVYVHAYIGKHDGRFEDCPVQTCIDWRAEFSDLTAAANQHDERVRAAERERLRKRVVAWGMFGPVIEQVLALLSEEAPNA